MLCLHKVFQRCSRFHLPLGRLTTTKNGFPFHSLNQPSVSPTRFFSTDSSTSATKPWSRKSLSESFLDGTSATYVEEMYYAWKNNPSAVHKSWDVFFRNTEAGIAAGEAYMSPPTLHGGAPSQQSQQPSQTVCVSLLPLFIIIDFFSQGGISSEEFYRKITDSMRLVLFIRAYQVRGHCIADLDPLGLDVRPEPPELKISRYCILLCCY
jgi:2-oxoglutarate dehydrogenase E1 component